MFKFFLKTYMYVYGHVRVLLWCLGSLGCDRGHVRIADDVLVHFLVTI